MHGMLSEAWHTHEVVVQHHALHLVELAQVRGVLQPRQRHASAQVSRSHAQCRGTNHRTVLCVARC